MIHGIGVDLVNVDRMERILCARSADRFITKVFCAEEIFLCQRAARPAECFAVRFAAKEAVVKALGTGFSGGIGPGMILVGRGDRTGPRIELRGKALEVAESLRLICLHVSLTHTRTDACAFVVAECAGT